MAAALRLLLRQQAAARTSPILRSQFPAPYSKAAAAAAAAAADSFPAARGAPLWPPCLREVTPRKAPPPPKGEPCCWTTVPSIIPDSTKSFPDKLKDLKDRKKTLQDMEKDIEEHEKMISKALDDRTVANDLFRKRLDDRRKLLAKISNVPDDYPETHNLLDVLAKMNDMMDGLAKVRKMRVDYDKDWAIQEAKTRVFDEQMKMLRKKREDYLTALRRYNELARSTLEQEENQEKDEPRCCETVPSAMTDSTKSLLGKLKDLKDLKDSKKALQDMEKDIEEHVEMIRKALHDRTVANDLFSKRLHDRQELLDKLRNLQDDYGKARNMRDGLAKLSKMEDDYDRDQAIERAKRILIGEQMEVLREKQQDYLSALRRYHELERSTMEQVQKVKKVVKVGAAVGLVGGLLLILAKI
ncbi:uncharacterized protein LOC124672379 [Lolium rigidum]|uniref:uncharacterized protein LOC124672379 n=1 Tax=Lolium rigidum TaxID=89674 RepID=UPI001F5E1328|nr:uncharacterized protein LOC124672379 [Lolium rigidum]